MALAKIGLDKYCPLFENEEIDYNSFVELDGDALRALEIPTGSRIKILKLVKELKEIDVDNGLNTYDFICL